MEQETFNRRPDMAKKKALKKGKKLQGTKTLRGQRLHPIY
jgi:hypothetical protein